MGGSEKDLLFTGSLSGWLQGVGLAEARSLLGPLMYVMGVKRSGLSPAVLSQSISRELGQKRSKMNRNWQHCRILMLQAAALPITPQCWSNKTNKQKPEAFQGAHLHSISLVSQILPANEVTSIPRHLFTSY